MGNKKYYWTKRLSIVGIFLIIINFFIIGLGIKSFDFLYLSFPIPCLFIDLFYELNLILIFLFILFQYTIYGYILDLSKNRIKITTYCLAIIHIVIFIIAYQNMITNFK